jgi:hypothetical protein
MPFARHVGTRIADQNLMKPRNIRDIAVTAACFVAILSTSVSEHRLLFQEHPPKYLLRTSPK